MLGTAVRALKQGDRIPDLTQPLSITSEINLRFPALLTSVYCPDVHERLTLYKRLANCDTEDDLREMQEELVDRYGEMPGQTQALLETHRLRLLCRSIGVAKLDAGPNLLRHSTVAHGHVSPPAWAWVKKIQYLDFQ